jgi:hypothetical protein
MMRERLFRHLANHHAPRDGPTRRRRLLADKGDLAGGLLGGFVGEGGDNDTAAAADELSAAAAASVLVVANPCDLVDHPEDWVGRWGGGASKRASRFHGQPFRFVGTGDAHGCSHVLRRVLWGSGGPGNKGSGGGGGDSGGDYGSGARGVEDLWESGPLALLGGAFKSFSSSSSSGGRGSSKRCVQGAPCPIEAVAMPRVPPGTQLVGMSSLFRTADALRLLAPGGLPHFPRPSLAELQKAAAGFCALQWTPTRWPDGTHAHSNSKEDLPRVCLHAVYVFTLLRDAYGLALDSRDLTFAHTLGGSELSWVLGAAVSQFASFRRTEAARAAAAAAAQQLQQGSHLRPAAGSGAAAKAAALRATHRSDLERFAFRRPPLGAPPELTSTLDDSHAATSGGSSSGGGSSSTRVGDGRNSGSSSRGGSAGGSGGPARVAAGAAAAEGFRRWVAALAAVGVALGCCARRCAARRARHFPPLYVPAYGRGSSGGGECGSGAVAGAAAALARCCLPRRASVGGMSRAGSWSLGLPPKRSRSGDENDLLRAV